MRLPLRLIEEAGPSDLEGIRRLREALSSVPAIEFTSEISLAPKGGYSVVLKVPDSTDVDQFLAKLGVKGFRAVF